MPTFNLKDMNRMKSGKVEKWIVKANEACGKPRLALEALIGGNGLKARAFRGGAWLGVGSVSEQSLRFLRNMILARLLAPSAFGTMAIVMSAVSLLQAFTEIGVREALIQNPKGSEPEYVNVAWWMALGRALSVYSVVFAVAPWVSRFYANPELTHLLRVGILSIVLEGAMSARAYVAMREMKFSRWATIFHGGGILGIITTIVLGLYIRDVWALVIGTCAESAGRCLLSYAVCPFFPSVTIDRQALHCLLKFSRGLFGLAPLTFVYMRADIFVLGKLVPAAALGYYSLGISVAQVPGLFALGLLGQILMPALSQIQDDRIRTRRIVLRVTEAVVLLGMPAVVFAYFCGRPLLTLIYGQPYAAAAGPLVLASCCALVNIMNGLITLAIYAAGAPHLHRRCVAAMALGMILLIYPSARWLGPLGAQLASLISITIGFLLQLERARHLTGIEISDYGKIFSRGALVSAIVMVVCLLAQPFATMVRPFLIVGVGMLGCLVAYGLAGVMVFQGNRLLQD
jgi:lipopolysaccharide exporter